MPRKSGINIFDQINFITNFIVAGCGPKRDLIIELQTEAAKDLLLILLGLDMQDVVQGFFDPRRGRNTKPGRHGRKRPSRFKFPDISDEVGKRVSIPEIGENFRKLPGGRYVLPGINAVEFVAIFAVVTEGIGDIVFDNVMGVLQLNPDYCTEFARFQRSVEGGGPIIVPGGGNQPVQFWDLDHAVGFGTNPASATCLVSRYAYSASATMVGTGPRGNWITLDMVIISNTRGVIARAGERVVQSGEVSEFTVSASADQNEFLSTSWVVSGGTGEQLSGTVIGYGQHEWLDW